jgi:hypothetical protein
MKLILIVLSKYIVSDNLLSVRLREVDLPIGTSSKVSASVKEGCPLNLIGVMIIVFY